jgi:TRAP-type C4-dicarboxylate transport system substrate-binding protein
MVFYIDGVWESEAHVDSVLEESDLTQILADKAAEADNVEVLGIFPGSLQLCILTRETEATSLKDLNGLRCETSPGTPETPIYTYTGMKGVPIPYEEVTTSLTMGVLDAAIYPAFVHVDLRLYEPANHMICFPGSNACFAIVINRDSWESLPADIRDIITDEVWPEAYEFAKVFARQTEDEAVELVSQNVETAHFVEPEELRDYFAFALEHSMTKVQLLMVDPRIMESIDALRPSRQ